MKFIPHDYQKFCIDYIKAHPISALFLDMGLGKTVITLTAIRDLMLDDLLVSKTLVIGPLRVARDTWPAEAEKWEHLNIQSGGHILIWYGLTWSLELYQQTNARLWRQGQTQTVTIHHIVTKNTVDEDVLAALASKDVTQEKLIAAVKARL